MDLIQNSVSTQLKAIAFPNLQQLTEDFTGRSHILNKIDQWLQQKDQQYFVLTGEPGVGKSAIAFHSGWTRHFSVIENGDLDDDLVQRSLTCLTSSSTASASAKPIEVSTLS